MSQNVLIAYYSLTGTTQQFAEAIQAAAGGDLFAIEMVTPYPKVYSEVLKVSREDWKNKVRPPLKNTVKEISDYEVIFIGSPNWFSTMAPPVFSFLESHDLAGKKVVPFLTHGGGGISNSFREVAEALPNSEMLAGLAIARSHIHETRTKVEPWLQDIGVI